MELIRRQTAKEKVRENNYYKKPVDEVIEKIKTSEEDKIILTGSRGCGKTTVLTSLSNDSIYTKNPYFMTRFEGIGIFSGITNEAVRGQLYEHYYELIMTGRLLNFIKVYYSDMFERFFKEDYEKISVLTKELDNFIRHYSYFEDYKIEKLYTNGTLIKNIINKFKEIFKLETLNLIIDRFDWIDNRKKISQEMLSSYFKYFDKSIITSDDKDLSRERIEDLLIKGYNTLVVDYGKDYNVIKEILRRYVFYYNSHLEEDNIHFPFYKISDELFKKVALLAEGDIESILLGMQSINMLYNWNNGELDFESQIPLMIEKELKQREEIESISQKRTLHL